MSETLEVEPRAASEILDVVVVGAGLSGIGAAYRLKTECPTRTFAVLEAREAIGGTWDLFRYPGIRSDSDMYTLGYPFFPWKEAKSIADGPSILSYIRETARTFDLEKHIRFRHKVLAASWSSKGALWTLQLEGRAPLRCRFLYACSGYYSYDRAHAPQFVDQDKYRGKIVHPQWWPQDLDTSGKRIVVIGSGATAVTLVPALARTAAHVTMLQRSPSWIASLPARDVVADALRATLPAPVAHRLVRLKNALLALGFYLFCRRFPRAAARLLRFGVRRRLPKGFALDPHFQPRYAPWDQRLCLVPDADLFDALASGKASIVTQGIERFTERGVRLASGEELEADVVVTATGLQLQALGGIQVDVDGRHVEPHDGYVYKGLMLSGVPNLAWCVGYTNASWTLRADLSSRWVCRLLNHMEQHGHVRALPQLDASLEPRPLLDLSAGYVTRAAEQLPRQGSKAPWRLYQNYLLDLASMQLRRVDGPGLLFG